ncbi:amylo-alpha-1,6-glucosidase [Pelagicoccus mobilis]|uniref:Glycogen debranching enzyme C-terminal domain-containing protein n=1 Tax=Pelagicoccus mobilis TaxID=415221 RepID=A0A934RZ58_9BACT|nr:amylo-alpha-1,6-glucosidase [Pelagicoccus mobilis]MBK1879013.1 hypothetical protein [Pelagicoccus mobilis]
MIVRALFTTFSTFLASIALAAPSNSINQELAQKILQDERLEKVTQMGYDLLSSGMNAGDKYDQVWIRDLNTFIVPLLEVAPQDAVRDALLTFFHFQGQDGNIVDGFVSRDEGRLKKYQRVYRYTPTRPNLKAHKNSVETDQESSLVQAVSLYIQYTNDSSILDEVVRDIPVRERLEMALRFPLKYRFASKYGLIWGGTTIDWGDVQAESPKGVELDLDTHRAVNIYSNALFMIAIDSYLSTVAKDSPTQKAKWTSIHKDLHAAVRKHLWDEASKKFIPHLYLEEGSPFPADYDENQIFYHGGTAVAIRAGLLTPDEISASLKRMRENVEESGAPSIGLTVYPIYPEGFFKSASQRPWYYMNGGDWTWFGARMIRQLARNGFAEEAMTELEPMLDRVIEHDGFYEWWSRDNQPHGANFRASAGVLIEAITELRKWAEQNSEVKSAS